jgi:uncharacterized protein YggT (Ycf19 family)
LQAEAIAMIFAVTFFSDDALQILQLSYLVSTPLSLPIRRFIILVQFVDYY